MEKQRPGEASVQYDDLRGETAGDLANVTLTQAAAKLGFKVQGIVVGIKAFASNKSPGKVYVTVQVFAGGSFADIQAARDANGGTLKVKELDKEIEWADFASCFKRLKISLFTKGLGVARLEVESAE
jgi:hypothetical protein